MAAPLRSGAVSAEHRRQLDADGTAGWIYRALGVEPIINCAGVRTNYGGSNPSPDVRVAMAAAAEAFVDLDELADGVGRRLAELTGAEWGVVTAGAAAALALTTAACIAGNDPDAMLRLPDTTGLPNRVVMPRDQRFAYDHAIRIAGGEIVTISSPEDLDAALDGSAVLVCLLGRADDRSAMPLAQIGPLARARKVPILVDAAGLLLGSKALCRAVWVNGAPHQALGRSMKVGKEEIVGAVKALEQWLHHRDARGDERQWTARLKAIMDGLASITAKPLEIIPPTRQTAVPRLRIRWDRDVHPIDAEGLCQALLAGRPRILIHDLWSTSDSITIDPFNLTDEQADVVSDGIRAVLSSSSPARLPTKQAEGLSIDLTGTWIARVNYLNGPRHEILKIFDDCGIISGQHTTLTSTGEVAGIFDGKSIVLEASHTAIPVSRYYKFIGEVDGKTLVGSVALGAWRLALGAWRCRR